MFDKPLARAGAFEVLFLSMGFFRSIGEGPSIAAAPFWKQVFSQDSFKVFHE